MNLTQPLTPASFGWQAPMGQPGPSPMAGPTQPRDMPPPPAVPPPSTPIDADVRARRLVEREAAGQRAFHMTVRAQVAARLKAFNANHAMHAWYQRNRLPIAAHAIAMLYLDPATPADTWIAVAGRLFGDSDDLADVSRLLVDFTAVARDVVAAGSDPRVEMSEAPEPMSSHAYYCGVAVSTLDTSRGLWRDVRRQVTSYHQIPGVCYAILTDATTMFAARGDKYALAEYQVWSTKPMDWFSGGDSHVRERIDDGSPVWRRLHQLHTILSGASR